MLRNGFYTVLYESGINSAWRVWYTQRKIILLGYHSVYSLENGNVLRHEDYKHLSIPVSLLRAHVEYLKTHQYKFLSLEDLVAIKQGTKKVPRHSVFIYFDDGFRDNYVNAYPVLKEQGVPATIFLATDLIDQKKTMWENVPVESPSDLSDRRRIFLTWDELRAMKDVFSFGSHSKSHPKFTTLTLEEMEREVVDAQERIHQELGIQVHAFSYPHGRSNAASRAVLEKNGYDIAVTTAYGFNEANADWMSLKKVSVKASDDMLIFKLKLGIYYPLRKLLKR
jgi:peptidoglycan/xylan/chitin deacetylase (PgdA/CDA1 family)